MKRRIWYWIVRTAGVGDGEMLPEWLIGLRWFFFPVEMLRWWFQREDPVVTYDPMRDTLRIYGYEYTGQLFRHFAYGDERAFKIIKREDGVITIQSLPVPPTEGGGMTNLLKGDIFRWRYTNKQLERLNDGRNGGTTYWCCSCIAVFNGEKFVDTYWGSSDNRTFLPSDVGKTILISYLGNFDNLQKAPHGASSYYRKEDIVDLRHANNSSYDNVFIRKGAERSLEVMRARLSHLIEESERKARFEKDWAERRREVLKNLTEENKNEVYV